MARWQIREGAAEDVPEIRSVAEAGWRATYGDILATETIDSAMAEWYDEASLRGQIEDDAVGFFVAGTAEVVGYCSGGAADGTGHLGAIYVDPDCQRSGIGTALLDQFEQWAQVRDCTELRIEVIADNAVGRNFYEKHGYRVTQRETADVFGEAVEMAVFGGEITGGR